MYQILVTTRNINSLFKNSRKGIFNGLLRKTNNIIKLSKESEVDLESEDLKLLSSKYLVKDIIHSNLERISNMKTIRPVRKQTRGITQVTNGQKKTLGTEYNPVHAIQEEKATFTSTYNKILKYRKEGLSIRPRRNELCQSRIGNGQSSIQL